jgi:hypothetical protein
MKITVTINTEQDKILDIQVDSEQRIKTTLRIIAEQVEEFRSILHIKEVQIKESGRRVGVHATYEEAQIYTGAQLVTKL